VSDRKLRRFPSLFGIGTLSGLRRS